MSKTILTKVDGWTPLIDALIRAYGLSVAAVFGRMWRYCQMSDNVCKASQETIATDLGLSRMTVSQHIATLVRDGYLADLTPDVRNRPHIYADTGKVTLQSSITAGSAQPPAEGGVKKSYTNEGENGAGVKKSYSTVKKSDTRCIEILHQGVKKSYMNKTLLRDSLINNERESARQTSNPFWIAENAWAAICGQLEMGMAKATYKKFIEPAVVLGWSEDCLVVQANEASVPWLASRLGKTVDRLLTGIVGQDARVEFVE
jgi:DNA-binding Lrp family transcriptional regulator